MRTEFVGIGIENNPGSVGRVASVLGDNGINITGFFVDGQNLWCQCDNVDGAVQALTGAGFTPTTTEFLGVELPNVPGAVGTVCTALGEAGINIEGTFGCVSGGANTGTVFLNVENVEGAIPVVEQCLTGLTATSPA